MSDNIETESRRQKGRVIIVSGPSGVGKGTLLKRLFAETDFPLVSSVSATTRAPRPGEKHGRDYWYLSREDFLKRRERGEFLESFEVYVGGNLYGTLRETVEKAVDEGRWVVLEIDVKGAKSVVEKIPEATTIFIAPPSIEELRKRLEARGSESQEEIAKRVAHAQEEIDSSDFYQYRVVNDNLDSAFANLINILKQESVDSSNVDGI